MAAPLSPAQAGLCAGCRHGQSQPVCRGPVYLRCRLHESDPRFAKYPRLPVVQCAGYAPVADAGAGER